MEVEINAIGRLGDGIGQANGDTIFAPFTLPGETITIVGEGMPPKILSRSRMRQEPVCEHFTQCGGCKLQHWQEAPYLEWKRALLIDALARQNIKAEVDPCRIAPLNSRRRLALTALHGADGVILGFHQAQSETVIGIQECPIALPSLVDALPITAELARIFSVGSELSISLTHCNNGIALEVTCERPAQQSQMEAATRLLSSGPIIRAHFNEIEIIQRAEPVITLSGVEVELPLGGFLQAVENTAEDMVKLTTAHLRSSKRVIDLFSGCGTFTLPLARRARCHAVESHEAALAALGAAAQSAGLKPVSTELRDLLEAPVMAHELKPYTGALMDPPRAGAEEQARQIALSDISKVAMVSCNPETLARDLRILIDGGFRIDQAIPFDQFLFSPHLEAVVLLSRKTERSKRPLFGRKV